MLSIASTLGVMLIDDMGGFSPNDTDKSWLELVGRIDRNFMHLIVGESREVHVNC